MLVPAEKFPGQALDPISDDGAADFLGNGDAQSAAPLLSRQHYGKEKGRGNLLAGSGQAQELPPLAESGFPGEGKVRQPISRQPFTLAIPRAVFDLWLFGD
jgi:hypothetical protein